MIFHVLVEFFYARCIFNFKIKKNVGCSKQQVLVPLIVVSVVVCTLNSEQSPSSTWFSLSSHQWTTWGTITTITSTGGVQQATPHHTNTTTTTTTRTGYSTSSNGVLLSRLPDLDAVEEEKEALFNSSTFNASSSTTSQHQLLTLEITDDEHLPPPSASNEGYTNKKDVKRYRKLEKIEAGLARARDSILKAARNRNLTMTHDDPDYVPQGAIYRNAYSFHRSYLEMEKKFKIFVYEEGEPPIFHDGPCKSIYSTEGMFIHQMEMENHFRTKDPDQAHVYFLPFSVVRMVQYLYEPNSHEIESIGRTVIDYVNVVARKYSHWNRSLGGDHFMLSCHDWGPRTSAYVPELFDNSIRVLCNANTSEGFNPSKDASFPEIHLRTGEITGLLGGASPSRRSVLAFFAGRLHGHIRYLLLQQWKNKDQDVQVYDALPNGVSYNNMLKKSKYCLCPSGYEVASPRVVEAIYAECVPVLISDNYVPPFSDVLNWDSFSVQIAVSDIPNIKRILTGISQSRYLKMQRRVKQVQKHFAVNGPPKRFDVFHMIVHSIWLRRLNFRVINV
ncbi:Exostosin-like [Macleaya cordata]|uniref:Exostosin-like n=1 Tax=Macleaya cordata TaxID=56857 RepID=A0A200RAI3_MACCD|nr:Exostosin-like [Macleaya cordata]